MIKKALKFKKLKNIYYISPILVKFRKIKYLIFFIISSIFIRDYRIFIKFITVIKMEYMVILN